MVLQTCAKVQLRQFSPISTIEHSRYPSLSTFFSKPALICRTTGCQSFNLFSKQPPTRNHVTSNLSFKPPPTSFNRNHTTNLSFNPPPSSFNTNHPSNLSFNPPPKRNHTKLQRSLLRGQVERSVATFEEYSTLTSPITSVVIPVYNEVESIGLLLEKIASSLQRRGFTYEIICVDDGSKDGTTRLLKALAVTRKDLRTLILRRNFGQTAALSAGFDAAVGDVIVTLDGDLQNDPDDIPRLVDYLLYGEKDSGEFDTAGGAETVRDDGGYDMVCGWRRERQDNLLRKVPSQVANWLIGQLTGVRLHDCGCTLKAFRSDLISSFRLYGEMHRLIPAIAAIEGASIAELPVRHHPRAFGSSKYPPLGRTPRVLLDLLVVVFLARFRDRPMQLFGSIGGCLLICAAICAMNGMISVWAVARHWGIAIAWPSAVPTLVLALELAVAGVQMILLGLLADMCMRNYFESQKRAHYNVREIVTSTSGVY